MSTVIGPQSNSVDYCFCLSASYRTIHTHQPSLCLVQLQYRKPLTQFCMRSTVTAQIVPSIRKEDTRRWKCMKQCGACCKLDDYDEDILREMLHSEEDVVEYLGMIGKDGWCKWFDSFTRTCTKYGERPQFCRATPETFHDLYGVHPDEFDEFAINCCEFHIENSYGAESQEAVRYSAFKDLPFEQNRIYEAERD